MPTALIISFFATGAVFPLGALLNKLAGGDLFAKSAIFTPLGLQLAAVQLFYTGGSIGVAPTSSWQC